MWRCTCWLEVAAYCGAGDGNAVEEDAKGPGNGLSLTDADNPLDIQNSVDLAKMNSIDSVYLEMQL
jgi:hypothetical protein